ncbi:MAG: HAMP domain-containing histidine kinase [Gammaproteobacteria bacterium]|nr:HAMP domain-containing histidine kinase [Gammaproteobacteria bacterium]MBT8049711.1 HAMP domain-containing histidine kinase [Gammaproteobacteria bacterium]MBT8055691.1 HAMP domain-containing histidine kinase [Gammaproteobacteria bacterium]NNJ78261.1 HAMP domain-containing histidine kinase [Xanthomonadales bacterium]
MQYRRRLRSRIVLSFLVFGTLLSALFAFSTLLLQELVEDKLIGETLEKELDDYLTQLRIDPSVVEPFYTRIQGYITRPGDPNQVVNPEFRGLEPGVHHVQTAEGAYKAAIRKEDDLWAFLIYDVSENQRIKQLLLISLIGVVALFSVFSFMLGATAARRVMKPVTDLAARLDTLSEEGKPERLSVHFADDEVGQLAVALDSYADRLHELVERDREFNADVSHELRSPLTVITGATELLLAQPDLDAKVRTRLLRIARAARQSADITTALLHLVRAEQGIDRDSAAHDVGKIVNEVVHLYEPLVGNKELLLRVEEQNRVNVIAPEAVVAVTVGNLIGNAMRYTNEGEVVITIGNGRVTVEDTGPGIPEEDLDHVFERHYRGQNIAGKGAGLGLAIVKRLCELYGWSIEFSNREVGGLCAKLGFYGE